MVPGWRTVSPGCCSNCVSAVSIYCCCCYWCCQPHYEDTPTDWESESEGERMRMRGRVERRGCSFLVQSREELCAGGRLGLLWRQSGEAARNTALSRGGWAELWSCCCYLTTSSLSLSPMQSPYSGTHLSAWCLVKPCSKDFIPFPLHSMLRTTLGSKKRLVLKWWDTVNYIKVVQRL